jgi:hypothetical protein
MITVYSSLLTISEHVMQLNRIIDECRREYEVLIEAVLNSQKVLIQPQLVSPAQILEQVQINQADMPSDVSLPIPTSATYQHLLLRIASINVFSRDHFLVYVIRLPLTNNVIYDLYNILPPPIKIREMIQNLYLSNLNATIC